MARSAGSSITAWPRTDPTGVAIGYLGLCFDVTAYQDGGFESERTAQHMISLLRHTRLIAVVLDRRGHVEFSMAAFAGCSSTSGRRADGLSGCSNAWRYRQRARNWSPTVPPMANRRRTS